MLLFLTSGNKTDHPYQTKLYSSIKLKAPFKVFYLYLKFIRLTNFPIYNFNRMCHMQPYSKLDYENT